MDHANCQSIEGEHSLSLYSRVIKSGVRASTVYRQHGSYRLQLVQSYGRVDVAGVVDIVGLARTFWRGSGGGEPCCN